MHHRRTLVRASILRPSTSIQARPVGAYRVISAKKVRCAIYTRKSSEEGLEQDFNSLHAQRDACAAYVQSQRAEGWQLVPRQYDDGGFSGGNLERPALQELLADIRNGAVDLIVVYKIDRLTRSLSDFAKLVELLEAHNASFVSVTQSFNTTTSMGRLTLNVLLSFAQFEREVTGERIRDKIGASKKKGMWMGGFVPLGYDAVGRQLSINRNEAPIVRRIFDLYRAHKNVSMVAKILKTEGVVSKQRPDAKGRGRGGVSYSNGALFNILRNPLYCGKIRHKASTYPGQHPAIVSEEEWIEVQAIRESRRVKAVAREQNKNPLLGLLVDDDGRRYRPTHTTKEGRRYRYYVSVEQVGEGTKAKDRARLPADELEQHVFKCLRDFLRSAATVLNTLSTSMDAPRTRKQIVDRAAKLADETTIMACRPLLRSIRVKVDSVDVVVDREAMRSALGLTEDSQRNRELDEALVLSIAARVYKTGHDLRLVFTDAAGMTVAAKRDLKLIRFLARGRRWYEELTTGRVPSIMAIARREKLDDSYVARVLYGALLAPDIVERILQGTQPVSLTVECLKTLPPWDWHEQRCQLGFARTP
jgi:DNA invertase Pin-like site-specific DNA recombinase